MKRKIVFILLVLMLFGSIGLFAQEWGYIKPTFGVVFAYSFDEYGNNTTFPIGFDVDFVSAPGLTFGFQAFTLWKGDSYFWPVFASGIGYTHTDVNWSAGGKLMIVGDTGGSRGLGISANATWYFNEFLGLTGIFGFSYFDIGMNNPWSTVALCVGISTKI